MLRVVPTVIWSRTYFCPHRLVHCADELGVSWSRWQPRSRSIKNLSPYRESSATHDGERAGWKSLANSHKTVESGVVISIGDAGSTRPGWMPTQVQVSEVQWDSDSYTFIDTKEKLINYIILSLLPRRVNEQDANCAAWVATNSTYNGSRFHHNAN